MEKENNIDLNYFKDTNEKQVLKEWLKLNSNIEINYIDREEFNNLKWDFLKETWKNKVWANNYTLFLPEDIKTYELISIFSRISKLLKKNEKEENNSLNNLKYYILKALYENNKLLKIEKDEQYKKEIEKNITRYIKFFEELFPENSIPDFRNSWFNAESYIEIKHKTNIKVLSELSEFKDSIEAEKEINLWLEEWIKDTIKRISFELWKDIIFEFLETFSKEDSKKIEWNDNIKTNLFNFFTENKEKLWKYLQVEKLKQELDEVRKSWDKRLISEKELQVSKILLNVLYSNYPRNNSIEWSINAWNSSPMHILETKEMVCVWKSIIWHTFLEYLWIKHYWANLPRHSALVIETSNWKKYYYDPTNLILPKEINLENTKIEWDYYIIPWLYHQNNEYNKLSIWDSETTLMWHININKWISLVKQWKYNEAIIYLEEAIKQNPLNVDFKFYIIWLYEKIWNYEKALFKLIDIYKNWVDVTYYYINNKNNNLNYKWYIDSNLSEHINRIYKKTQKDFDIEYQMWLFFWNDYFKKAMSYKSDDYKKYETIWIMTENYNTTLSIKAYEESLKLNPNNKKIISKLWEIYYKLKEYDKALDLYLMLEKLWDKSYSTIYTIWLIYYKKLNYKESIIYINKIEVNEENFLQINSFKAYLEYLLWNYTEAEKLSNIILKKYPNDDITIELLKKIKK